MLVFTFDKVLIVIILPCRLNVLPSSFTNVAINVLAVDTVIVKQLNLIPFNVCIVGNKTLIIIMNWYSMYYTGTCVYLAYLLGWLLNAIWRDELVEIS